MSEEKYLGPDIGNPLGIPSASEIDHSGEQPAPAEPVENNEALEVMEIASDDEVDHTEEVQSAERAARDPQGVDPMADRPEAQTEPADQPAPDPNEVEYYKQRAAQAEQYETAIRTAAEQKYQEQQEALRETDPEAYLSNKVEQLEQANHQQQMAQVYNQAVQAVEIQEEQFRKTNPDYDDALEFAIERRRAIIKGANPQMPDEAVERAIVQGNHAVALRALQHGQNPAHVAYELSKQFGYGGQGQPAGQAQQYQQPAGPAPRPTMTSLSAVAGKSGGGRGRKVTSEQVANADLDTAEGRQLFDAVTKDPAKHQQIEEYGYTYL